MTPLDLIVPIAAAVVVFAVVRAAMRKPLQARVAELGDPRGRTIASIVAKLGEPDDVTRYADGNRTMLWRSPKYQIALIALPDGTCGGVHMEHSSRNAPPRNRGGHISVGFSASTDL